MRTGKRLGSGISQAAAVTGMLLIALLLVGVLAVNAISSAQYHRETAEGVLRDYAALAAEQYRQRLTNVLSYRAYNPLFAALTRGGAENSSTSLITAADITAAASRDEIPGEAASIVAYTFRYDFRSREVEFSGQAPEARDFIESLSTHAESSYDSEWPFAVVYRTDSDGGNYFAYRVSSDGDGNPAIAFGVGGPSSALGPHFRMASAYGPLLPPSLTGGVERDSLLAVTVTGPSGQEMYRSGPGYVSSIEGSDQLSHNLGGLDITAALAWDAADELIIGGLPESRVPMLAGLLVLTVGLLVVALIILKREHELSRLRSDFVSGVSHELRTPLAQIRMFAETLLLQRVRNDAERDKSLQIINRETTRLTQLIDNLLQFSKSERGVGQVELKTMNLVPLLLETIEGFSPLAEIHQVKIVTDLKTDVIADVDPSAIQQMLLNLLDNAVKYGSDGQRVTVGITQSHGCALIWVADEGPGIPDQDRDRVWERFWRRNDKRVQAVAGTGIGLSVVRDLAELHGGRVWVTNLKKGARFVIALPVSQWGAPVRVKLDELDRYVPAPAIASEGGAIA